MANKIDKWRLDVKPDDKDAWNGTVTVTLNRYELSILASALSSAEYEGVIDLDDRDYMLDKLNIEL